MLLWWTCFVIRSNIASDDSNSFIKSSINIKHGNVLKSRFNRCKFGRPKHCSIVENSFLSLWKKSLDFAVARWGSQNIIRWNLVVKMSSRNFIRDKRNSDFPADKYLFKILVVIKAIN
jgi:hypothetical protein